MRYQSVHPVRLIMISLLDRGQKEVAQRRNQDFCFSRFGYWRQDGRDCVVPPHQFQLRWGKAEHVGRFRQHHQGSRCPR